MYFPHLFICDEGDNYCYCYYGISIFKFFLKEKTSTTTQTRQSIFLFKQVLHFRVTDSALLTVRLHPERLFISLFGLQVQQTLKTRAVRFLPCMGDSTVVKAGNDGIGSSSGVEMAHFSTFLKKSRLGFV